MRPLGTLVVLQGASKGVAKLRPAMPPSTVRGKEMSMMMRIRTMTCPKVKSKKGTGARRGYRAKWEGGGGVVGDSHKIEIGADLEAWCVNVTPKIDCSK